MNNSKLRPRGFTLIELMIAIAIVGMLLGIGVPNFSDFILKNQMRSLRMDLIATFQWARYEAVKQGKKVTLCGTNDGKTCSQFWHNQLLAFVDTNNNKIVEDQELIKKVSVTKPPGWIKTKTGKSYIRFIPDGRVNQGGSWVVCTPKHLEYAKEMVFNFVGRPYWNDISHSGSTLTTTTGIKIPCV